MGILSLCSVSILALEVDIPLLSIEGANWTKEESAYIRLLNKKGSIKVATRIISTVYLPQKDGSITGFHYNVLKEFADLAKIDLDIKLVSWNDYFHKNAEDLEKAKLDLNYSYVPSLIEDVDLYLDGITELPWREKMFDIIKYIPSRHMIISRFENHPKQISDLNNKSCVMAQNTSMALNLSKLKDDYRLNFNCISVTDSEKMKMMDEMVAEGKVDFTVYDSDRAFSSLMNFDNLTILWPVSEIQMMGWAINKKNKMLKNILDKYISYAQKNAILDKYWKRSYGVSFIDYMKVLNIGVPKH
ncbi:MAG: membrane-bound lytic murein transglycosylase MltF [Enterobacterales bacterium]|jgi:membrane-bound lytic murein transglycosylase MltF